MFQKEERGKGLEETSPKKHLPKELLSQTRMFKIVRSIKFVGRTKSKTLFHLGEELCLTI